MSKSLWTTFDAPSPQNLSLNFTLFLGHVRAYVTNDAYI